MNAEDLFKLTLWGHAVSTPMGQILLVESTFNQNTNQAEHRIVQTEWKNGTWAPLAPFTHGKDDKMPQISPDGKLLAFISGRSGTQQLWTMPLEGGEPRSVTHLKGGIKGFAWHPNAKQLVVVAKLFRGLIEDEKGKEEAQEDQNTLESDTELSYHFTRDVKVIAKQYYKYDGEGYLGESIDTLVEVDLEGKNYKVLTPGLQDSRNPAFSADGRTLFYLQRPYQHMDKNPTIREIFWLRGQEMRQLTHLGLNIMRLVVHPEGRYLLFTATDPQDLGYGNETLWRYDLSAEQLTCLTASLDRPIGDHTLGDVAGAILDKPLISADGQWAVVSVSDHGRVNLWNISLKNEQHRPLTRKDWTIYSYALHPQGFVVIASDPLSPSSLALLNSSGEMITDSLEVRLPWPQEDLVKPIAYDALNDDGTRVDAWIMLPRRRDVPSPVVLQIHGGPMAMYGYRFMFEMQFLCSRGYAVMYGNPRGSQGYGQNFCGAIIGHWGDKDYSDVMAILEQGCQGPWKKNVEVDNVAVMGGSYGGFMVNWAISHTDRFCCAVTMRSVVNRLSAMGTSDLGWLRVPQYGKKPWWEDPEPYWQQSPLRYASAIHTPLLIEHQMNDYRLPLEQGEQLYHALKYLGREVKMILYPGESHGMVRSGAPWHRVYRLRQILTWLDAHMKTKT